MGHSLCPSFSLVLKHGKTEGKELCNTWLMMTFFLTGFDLDSVLIKEFYSECLTSWPAGRVANTLDLQSQKGQ
jgi:hypothetical protein